MIPVETAELADLIAKWDSRERDNEDVAFASWLLENLKTRGFALTKQP